LLHSFAVNLPVPGNAGRRGREGRHLVYGRTNTGRFLFVVVAIRHRRTSVITAREMNNTNLHLRGDQGGSKEPIAEHPVRTQAYVEVRRGEQRSDNEGIHLKASWYKVEKQYYKRMKE
jgi:hypothetical protein